MSLNIETISKAFDRALFEVAQELPVMLQAYIGAEMDIRGTSTAFQSGKSNAAFTMDTAKNTGKRLRIATSRLYRSLNPKTAINKADSVYNVRVTGQGLEVEYGTNVEYARIHEEGGTIVQNPTAKQRRFFWAMYKESTEGKWSAMARAKKLTINIPKRPYFKPGTDAFEREATPSLQAQIRNRVAELLQ